MVHITDQTEHKDDLKITVRYLVETASDGVWFMVNQTTGRMQLAKEWLIKADSEDYEIALYFTLVDCDGLMMFAPSCYHEALKIVCHETGGSEWIEKGVLDLGMRGSGIMDSLAHGRLDRLPAETSFLEAIKKVYLAVPAWFAQPVRGLDDLAGWQPFVEELAQDRDRVLAQLSSKQAIKANPRIS